MLELAYKALDLLLGTLLGLRRVRVRVHLATRVQTGEVAAFIKVVNLSSSRDVEITHVWFAGEQDIQVINPERPLPIRLQSDETWETWLPLNLLPVSLLNRVFNNGRVQLSTGSVFKSKQNKRIPAIGYIAGGAPASDRQYPTQDEVLSGLSLYGLVRRQSVLFEITTQATQLALDVDRALVENGTRLLLWYPHRRANQLWRLLPSAPNEYAIVSRQSGKCLTVENASQDEGARVVIWDDVGHSHQRWRIHKLEDATYQIVAVHSGLCLSAADDTAAANVGIVQSKCTNRRNQRWWLGIPITLDSSGAT